MDIEKGPKKSEEEYHYSDDQLGQEEEESPPKESKIKALRKRLFIILGIIFAIYVMYKFLGRKPAVEAEQEQSKPMKPVAVQSVQPVQTVEPVQVVQPAQPIQAGQQPQAFNAEQQLRQTSSIVETQVQSLAQQNLANNNQIQTLRTEVSKLNESVEQLQGTLNTLTTSLQSIVAEATQLQAKAASGMVKRTTIKSGPSKRGDCSQKNVPCCPNHCCATSVCATPCTVTCLRKVPSKAVFHLKAVVPGRAWLESSTGTLITVKVGDSLRGYGVVKAINATQGWVGTSSGTVIRYGPNDS